MCIGIITFLLPWPNFDIVSFSWWYFFHSHLSCRSDVLALCGPNSIVHRLRFSSNARVMTTIWDGYCVNMIDIPLQLARVREVLCLQQLLQDSTLVVTEVTDWLYRIINANYLMHLYSALIHWIVKTYQVFWNPSTCTDLSELRLKANLWNVPW